MEFRLLICMSSLLLVALPASSIASNKLDTDKSKPLQVTLHDNSRQSVYGWKISSKWFSYFQDIVPSSLNISSLSSVDTTALHLETVHGTWLLEKEKEQSTKTNFDEDSEEHAYFQFASSSQLYDNLEITACLYGNSFLNVSAHSQYVILQDKCKNNQQPHWKNFTVSLAGSGMVTVGAVTPDKGDFLLIDKIIVSKIRHIAHGVSKKGSLGEDHLILTETTQDCA